MKGIGQRERERERDGVRERTRGEGKKGRHKMADWHISHQELLVHQNVLPVQAPLYLSRCTFGELLSLDYNPVGSSESTLEEIW